MSRDCGGSCLAATPAEALAALKTGNLEEFAACLDSKTFDPEAPLGGEHGGVTLLEAALESGRHQAVELLLDRGVRPDRWSPQRRLAPIHVAVGGGAQLKTVSLLVSHLAPGGLEVRDCGGQTALHLAAQRGDQGLPLLLLLLESGALAGAQDSRAGHSVLDMAALAGCWKAVKHVAAAGGRASHNTLALLEQRWPNSVKSLGLREALETLPQGGAQAADALFENLPSEPEEPTAAWLELLHQASPQDLELPHHELTLVQAASTRGLVQHLKLLLESGASPNSAGDSCEAAPLVVAAQTGRLEVFRLLLEQPDISLEGREGRTERNVLLMLLCRPEEEGTSTYQTDYDGCLELLLNMMETKRTIEECQMLVNQQDSTGCSPLHYATQLWTSETVRRLLGLGASVGLTNLAGEAAVSAILPDTLEQFLDSACLRSNHLNPANEKFSITFDYSFLAPADQMNSAVINQEDFCPLLSRSSKESRAQQSEKQPPGPETAVLLTMTRSPDLRRLLKHPVITSFLALKWDRISLWYNFNISFVLLLVVVLTSFIFANYGGPSLGVASPHCEDNTSKLQPYGNNEALWIILTILTFVILTRETIQFLVAPLNHLKSFENILEIILIILLGVLLFHGPPGCHPGMKRELSSALLLVSWMELLTMLGRHPKMHWCNIYSTMFFRVLTTFLTFLLWYSLFIVAFGLGFYILLHKTKDDNDQNTSGTPDEEKQAFFDGIGLSMVKTFSMFVGELEFSEVPFHVNPRFSYIFFLVFVFLMVVVLMNLLNGLAVSYTVHR